jgi:hypothetical protein
MLELSPALFKEVDGDLSISRSPYPIFIPDESKGQMDIPNQLGLLSGRRQPTDLRPVLVFHPHPDYK